MSRLHVEVSLQVQKLDSCDDLLCNVAKCIHMQGSQGYVAIGAAGPAFGH